MKTFRRISNARRLLPEEIPAVKGRIARGDKLQDIAADYRVNHGRISEIKTGRKWADQTALSFDKLPPPVSYAARDGDRFVIVLNQFRIWLGKERWRAIMRSMLAEDEENNER